eukprot:CAMPEP_0167743818 /NCGR_PEP_ID=MMETSP0110_2-20121227/2227_1 /TAXON_ID=629695 /ORGANISM="Gymnochlora sp., Strain CCMP2014" /LENGTH=55 /DNA_ID=CAMNT_0007628231 /DNA_START=172 /DNA_END=339 /DNA_ORIENTATION=-
MAIWGCIVYECVISDIAERCKKKQGLKLCGNWALLAISLHFTVSVENWINGYKKG